MCWRLVVFVTACVLVAGCGNRRSAGETTRSAPVETGIPNDFLQFYTRFHADTAFQMARIAFPLEGIPADKDSLYDAASFRWHRSDWRVHRPLVNDDERFDQTFDVLGEGLIVETISDRHLPLAMQRRFARMAGGWNLIYYVEMQPMSRSDQ